MQYLKYGDKAYRPLLTKAGMLDVRTAVAYGPRGSGTFMLSVYVVCVPKGAGMHGGKVEDQRMEVRAYREYVPDTTSHETQRQRLDFMLNIVATRLGYDYVLRLPIETKNTPKYAQGIQPMSVLFDEIESELQENTDGIQRPVP